VKSREGVQFDEPHAPTMRCGVPQLNELPGLHDLREPRVEHFEGGDFVQEAALDKSDLARVAHDRIVPEEHRRLRAVDEDSSRVVHDTGGLVELEAGRCYLCAAIRRHIDLEAFIGCRVLQGNGERPSLLIVCVNLQVRRIVDRKVILLIAIQQVPERRNDRRDRHRS
jgi:hypothetical protein